MRTTDPQGAFTKPSTALVNDLVRRIVEGVHPLRIILFGSAARGEMGPNSDLDVLVIMPDGTHRRKTSQLLHERMWGLGFAKDIIVATAGDVRRHGDDPGLIYSSALREGRELYHAGA